MEHANVPVYDKVVKRGHISGKLSVPIGWIAEGKLLPAPIPGAETIPIRVKDEVGHEMILRLTVRKPKEDGTNYHMKPEFMFKEWHALVDKYRLNEGDSVYFWKEGSYLRVKVRVPPRPRTIILFDTRMNVF